ncbi:KTSC domain-containing protein [Halomarina halobia]|uniref:KTSC domain-containing protein n=1 Tax=Halomarina halobia TaxID=3033386 RepID=A0ABD6AE11_9EURY|nr:KTSC domain-containing protein [Halomarina sp. PSR21]
MKAITADGESIECTSIEETEHGVRLYDEADELVGYVPYPNLLYVTRWRIPVSSSSIESVGYDDAEMTLEIAFEGDRVYRYLDVPRGVYEGILSASSKGRYFHDHVRGKFHYLRVA